MLDLGGYFINPEAQCSSRTKAPLLSSLRPPPPRQTAEYSLPRLITAHSCHNSTLNINTTTTYRASEYGINRNTACAPRTHCIAAVNLGVNMIAPTLKQGFVFILAQSVWRETQTTFSPLEQRKPKWIRLGVWWKQCIISTDMEGGLSGRNNTESEV